MMMCVSIALRALRKNKLRSTLTISGIVIGVAAVLMVVGIGLGARRHVEEQIQLLGSNLLHVSPGSSHVMGVRLGAGTRSTLTEDDAHAIQLEIQQVQAAAPALHGSGQITAQGTNWFTSFHGSTPEYFDARHWKIASGRPFDAADIAAAAKVVLLGETVARNLFGDTDPIGQIVRLRKVPMEVIGVLTTKGPNLSGGDQDDVVLIPISTARNRVLGGSQAKLRLVRYISIKVREGADVEHVADEIRNLLRQRHRLQPDQNDDFTLRDLSEVRQKNDQTTRAMVHLLVAIAAVSLIVGGIGIMNIMLVSIAERTREIGLRMAVGARSRDIRSQFLAEALILALVGGCVGVALGIVGTNLIEQVGGWSVPVDASAVALSMGAAAAVGLCFGVYPAHKASRLTPIQALRYD